MTFYTHQDRSTFDQDFATVYSKMLEIGVNNDHLVDFIEPSSNGVCGDTIPNDTTQNDTTQNDNLNPRNVPSSTIKHTFSLICVFITMLFL